MKKYIVLFELILKDGSKETYLEMASKLKPMLADFEGFISAERFQSVNNDNKLLSMNMWESEEAIKNWRNIIEHRMSQLKGKTSLFESYKITVVETTE